MMGFERRWVRHLLAAFAPVGGPGLAPLEGEVDYLSAFVRMKREANPLAGMGLRLAVWMAALAPLWLWGKLSTINRLAGDRRTQLLGELLRHRLFAVRELSLLLKLCAAMALLGAPSVRLRSGYDSIQTTVKSDSGMRAKLPIFGQTPSTWSAEESAAALERSAREAR